MFGLEESKKKPFEFDLEKDIKKHPKKAKELIEHAQENIQEIKSILLKGEKSKVWVRYKAQATHKGEAWGFKPTNKRVGFEAAAILYINQKGKVHDMWEAYCFYDILTDLGLVPPLWELHKHLSNYKVY